MRCGCKTDGRPTTAYIFSGGAQTDTNTSDTPRTALKKIMIVLMTMMANGLSLWWNIELVGWTFRFEVKGFRVYGSVAHECERNKICDVIVSVPIQMQP